MFDEKWMNGTEDKPIETIEDALFLLASFRLCSSVRCRECAMHMYDHSDGNCSKRLDECLDFILHNLGMKRKDGVEGQQVLYKALLEDRRLGELPSIGATATHCSGTCAECQSSQMHSSGILWCKSFGNFVHENGYCYRFASSVTMEEMGR